MVPTPSHLGVTQVTLSQPHSQGSLQPPKWGPTDTEMIDPEMIPNPEMIPKSTPK